MFTNKQNHSHIEFYDFIRIKLFISLWLTLTLPPGTSLSIPLACPKYYASINATNIGALSSELKGSHCTRLPVSEVIWWWHCITLNSPQTLVSACPSKPDRPCDVLPWTLDALATHRNLLLHSHCSVFHWPQNLVAGRFGEAGKTRIHLHNKHYNSINT